MTIKMVLDKYRKGQAEVIYVTSLEKSSIAI